MTDLRDQLAETVPILLHGDTPIGPLLRRLRHRNGYTVRRLAFVAHVSKSGIQRREQRPGMSLAAFIQHAQGLGYAVALVPLEPDRRTA